MSGSRFKSPGAADIYRPSHERFSAFDFISPNHEVSCSAVTTLHFLSKKKNVEPPPPYSKQLRAISETAVAILVCGVEQFLHPELAPGVPLEKSTPLWIPAHLLWSYLAGAIFVVAGASLLINQKVRLAATVAGLMTLLLVVIVYVPNAKSCVCVGSKPASMMVCKPDKPFVPYNTWSRKAASRILPTRRPSVLL